MSALPLAPLIPPRGLELSHVDKHGQQHTVTDVWAGARHVCAPPLCHSPADLQSVWDSATNGTINVISSDHASSLFNSPAGKRKPVADSRASKTVPNFAQIPNGLPGVETRLPILFTAATDPDTRCGRKMSLPKFVALTSTNAAKMYALGGRKGSIAPGYDSDLVIRYPPNHADLHDGHLTITNDMLHHSIDYTPFEGTKVNNWPRYVLLRGELKWNRDVEVMGVHGNTEKACWVSPRTAST